MRLALFEPDIPQNLGSFIRLAACLGTALDIIEPCGFPVDDKRIRRAAMDYYDLASIARHASWHAFQRIPLQKGARSLNVALAAAMVLSEALRQTSGFDALAL